MKAFLRTRVGLLFWTLAMLGSGYGAATFNQMRFVVVTLKQAPANIATDRQQHGDEAPTIQWSWI